MIVRERRQAHAELLERVRYYELQRSGLGLDLLDAVDHSIDIVADFPHSPSPYPGWNRRPVVRVAPVHGFPISIIYFVDEDSVVVLAYAHHRQRPGYWLSRLS